MRLANMVLISLLISVACEKENNVDNKVIDIDGNIYPTVKIGTQVWMVENLKTTRLNDGSDIPLVTDRGEWKSLITSAYCWYDNNKEMNKNTYGALYNWYTVETDKLCPCGWHLPTYEEWLILTDFLGGIEIAGGKLKEEGTAHWNSPNTGATNESGFKALPGGSRQYSEGIFEYINSAGFWWTMNENNTETALFCVIEYNDNQIFYQAIDKRAGFSVRCVKD